MNINMEIIISSIVWVLSIALLLLLIVFSIIALQVIKEIKNGGGGFRE